MMNLKLLVVLFLLGTRIASAVGVETESFFSVGMKASSAEAIVKFDSVGVTFAESDDPILGYLAEFPVELYAKGSFVRVFPEDLFYYSLDEQSEPEEQKILESGDVAPEPPSLMFLAVFLVGLLGRRSREY